MGKSLLSVSIVSGPAAPELLRRLAKTETNVRWGLLASPKQGESPASNSGSTSLFVEELALPRAEEGQGPEQIAKQIREIAARNAVDHLLIECDADTPAIAFASLFLPQAEPAHSLSEATNLTATIFAIAPHDLLDALIHRRDTPDSISPCFIAEQLEFASIVFLDGADDDLASRLAREIVTVLNPDAQIFERAQPNLERVLKGTGDVFDFAAALDGAGWRRLIESDSADEARGEVRAFAYHARKPFHPERFWNLVQGGFPGVFRAKGFFWLASRMDLVGGLNLAGTETHYASAGQWWAARDDHAREFHMPARTRKEWREPFGDRRQAIAFMGVELDADSLRTQLDSCLLTEAELAAGTESWHELIDPFPSWTSHHHHHHHDHGDECDHEHEHEHEHGSGEHDCCHH